MPGVTLQKLVECCNVETAFRLTTILTGVLEICSLPSCRLVSANGMFECTGTSGGLVVFSAGLKFSEISTFMLVENLAQ